MEMIYDCFTFSGETDTLEIRFNILDEFVDKFVIIEGKETFSGRPKKLYFDSNKFKKWEDKIIYRAIGTEDITANIALQIEERRDYVDQPHFVRAFIQKEMIREVLEELNLSNEDIIYYGDVDEFWKPKEVDDKPHKLRQLAYSYYLNNRSEEDWRGTIVTKWKNIKGKCLNDLRANPIEEDILEDGGWHFTNLGGYEAVITKLESYDHQEVNIPWVKDGLAKRMEDNVDFLGRGYKMWIDDKELPQYILDNKDEWIKKGLWKN